MNDEERKILFVSSRRKVLEELIKSGEGTSYYIAKKLNVADSAVGKHLAILHEAGLVEEPLVDLSQGRLRKVYKPSKKAKEILKEFWIEEVESAPKFIKESLAQKLGERED